VEPFLKTDTTVGQLVDLISRGELRLPALQRRYVWPATRVRDLLDSLYRGYPSGSILVWETTEGVPERDMAIEQQVPVGAHKLLLDGQQRLTSLSAVIRGEPLKLRRARPVEIAFNLDHPEGPPSEVEEIDEDEPAASDELDEDDDEEEEPAEPAELSVQEKVKHRTFVVAWKALLKNPTWVRVTDVFNKSDADLLSATGITSLKDPKYERYSKRLQRLRQIRDYPYVMQSLRRDLSYEEVAAVFVRVNSLGMKLRGSDLALALITSRWPESLALFEKLAEDCEKKSYELDLGVIVRTLVVFATKQSRFMRVPRVPIGEFKTAWPTAREGLNYAIDFLRANAMVESLDLLSSANLIIVIAAFAMQRSRQLAPAEERGLLRWFYTANALAHYSGSSETTLDTDLKAVFDGRGPDALLEILQQRHGRLEFRAEDFAGRGARHPLFATAFLAFQRTGARDWLTGLGISLSHSSKHHYVQEHHIFPRSLLAASKMYNRSEINEIANLAIVSGGGNRAISNQPPAKYLPKILGDKGAAALTAQSIPLDEALWELDRFRDFLSWRRAALATTVNQFLQVVGDPVDAQAASIAELVRTGESDSAEFKESARINYHTGEQDPALRLNLAKTVAGFLNKAGGAVVVGIADGGVVSGIEKDISSLGGKNNFDGYEQYLRQALLGYLPKGSLIDTRIRFENLAGRAVCAVVVPRAVQPVYLSDNGSQRFFVRNGNATIQLQGQDLQNYLKQRFP
jgi:hypothetical protein